MKTVITEDTLFYVFSKNPTLAQEIISTFQKKELRDGTIYYVVEESFSED